MIRLWRDGQRTELAFLLLYILYFVLISAGPEANARFRVPVVPLLAVLAGHGLLGGHRQAHTSG